MSENLTRVTYNEMDDYSIVVIQKGKAMIDAEQNEFQRVVDTKIRRFIQKMFGDGTPDDGFKCIGTGANNDFTIQAGDYYVDGYRCRLGSNVAYMAQPNGYSTLTPPVSGDRTDEVYLEVWEEEIDATEDTGLKDPVLNIETARRIQVKWRVKVIEGGTTPSSQTDSVDTNTSNPTAGVQIGVKTKKLSTLTRHAGQNAINVGDAVDVRTYVNTGNLYAEIVAARGSMTTLDARLDVLLNENGSVKMASIPSAVPTTFGAAAAAGSASSVALSDHVHKSQIYTCSGSDPDSPPTGLMWLRTDV
jgi:hypothetical protein